MNMTRTAVCYIPVIEEENKRSGFELAEPLDEDGYFTNDKSKVTCRECLEYIHA